MANVLSLVSYQIFPAKTGGQKGIAYFNKYFSACHDLICVTVKDNDPASASYQVLNILSNSIFRYVNVFYFFTISRLIKKYRVSHIILEHPYYGWLGLLLRFFLKIKMITHSHNIEAQRFKSVGKWWWRLLEAYEKYIYQHSDAVFCISAEDRQYLIDHYKLMPKKCSVITYGIELDRPPSAAERLQAKKYLQDTYNIPDDFALFLFNGTLDYLPNLDALKNILNKINPELLFTKIPYKIIICGKNLPPQMNELKEHRDKNIIYAGFVDDVSLYFKGADVFINPITDGGGIKTKLVEALGYGLAAVSTFSGAFGVSEKLCNGKLLLVNDYDWKLFALKMAEAKDIQSAVGTEYFEHFYWKNIGRKAAKVIDDL